jgi:hypothetical protein
MKGRVMTIKKRPTTAQHVFALGVQLCLAGVLGVVMYLLARVFLLL